MIVLVAAAYAMDYRNGFGFPGIFHEEFAGCRAGLRQDPLEFKACIYLGNLSVPELQEAPKDQRVQNLLRR